MKKARDYWAPDPSERAAEIKARRAMLEREHVASIRARIGLLQNLRPEQCEIFDKLIADVLASPRDDASLRDPLTRLHSYVRRRESDPRCAKPIPPKARAEITKALSKRGMEPTEEKIRELFAQGESK